MNNIVIIQVEFDNFEKCLYQLLDLETTKNAIKQVYFEEIDENNVCDVSRGIPLDSFKTSVELIAKQHSFPDSLVNTIIDASKFDDGKVINVRKLKFRGIDSQLYLGKFAVEKLSGDRLAIAYSFHGMRFKLAPKEIQPDSAATFIKFADVKSGETGEVTTKAFVSKNGEDMINDYYLFKASREFESRCAGPINAIKKSDTEQQLNDESKVINNGKSVLSV